MKVKDFFGTNAESSNQQSTQVAPKVADGVAKKKTVQTLAPDPPKYTVNIHIEKPDIILLEDMDNIDSNCIILNVCCSFIYFLRLVHNFVRSILIFYVINLIFFDRMKYC